jgi:NAD(P)-dependent dehydrogenase (short-subunit alcohol dehydrogenase family)
MAAKFVLRGAIAVVSGAASGIGSQLAHDLAQRGATVYGVDVNSFTPAVEAISPRQCDVSDSDRYQEVLREIEASEGRIDVLANVAGIDHPLSAIGATPEAYQRIMAVNFFSVVAGTLAVLPGMARRQHGAIVNVASDSVRTPIAGESAYAATKGAIAAFTESVSHEVADRDVFVYVLYPGWVPTSMGLRSLEHGMKQPPKIARRTPEQVSAATLRALGRSAIEINTVKGAVLAPLARAFLPQLYRRSMKGRAMPS